MAESLVTNLMPDAILNNHERPKITAKKGHNLRSQDDEAVT